MPKTTYYERAERRRESLPSVIVGGILGGVLVLGITLAPDYSDEQAPQPMHSGDYYQEQSPETHNSPSLVNEIGS